MLWKISQNSKENICAGISFSIKLNSADLQLHQKWVFSAGDFNTTGWLLLIIAVSIVVKRVLANETGNYDTKTKAYVLIWDRSVIY